MDNQTAENPPVTGKAWVIAVNMGYGHQRTAYPLRDIAVNGTVINANQYQGIPKKDKDVWIASRNFYEFTSRFRRIPLIGVALFLFLDSFQKILRYYPKRDLSASTFGLKRIFNLIGRGWQKDLIEKCQKNPLPIISTFFTPAFAAESFNYPNDIYCIVCDADTNRSWAPLDPQKSRIKYFAPCTWARDRLKLYGIRPENIFLTGYPLPKENVGKDMEILKQDLRHRLLNLDPAGKYRKLYQPLVQAYLGELPAVSNHPLTIMFSIGGAGAQTDIAIQTAVSLKKELQSGSLQFVISVGTRKELKTYFENRLKGLQLNQGIRIISGSNMNEYFKNFNAALRTTDVLITKPSELSFYAGLGIPIIIAPPLGSQEDFNKRWLLHVGAGIEQDNPRYTNEWFFDLLETGDFAEMAMQGFIEIEKLGTYHIEDMIAKATP